MASRKKVTPEDPFPDPLIIFTEVRECMQQKIPSLTNGEVSDLWEYGMQKNHLILKYLQTLMDYNKTQGEIFKVKSYRNAISIISAFHIPIVSGSQLKKFKGIGTKISSKIQEILDTGKLKEVDENLVKELERVKIITELSSVYAIGTKSATDLVEQGIKSIEDLKKHTALLNDEQRKGLKYYDDISIRIPRDEITTTSNYISSIFERVDPNIKIEVCGSYRRGATTSGDIDLLVAPSIKGGLPELVGSLEKDGVLLESFKLGPVSFTGVVKLPGRNIRQLDIHTTNLENWGAALLHFTGSGPFNVRLRLWAKNLGYKLSDKGLLKGATKIKVNTEKAIFEELGVKYLEPSERV